MLGNKVLHYDSLSSTNDYLINLCKDYHMTDSLIVLADKQTSGKGRLNHKWYSNNGLFFSFLLDVDHFSQSFYINILTSLSVVKVLKRFKIDACVKYPNDIIVANKKIAGILIESIVANKKKYLIVGLGLNVNNSIFPNDICDAVSMNMITGLNYNKKNLLDVFALEFNKIIKKSNQSKQKIFNLQHYIKILYGYEHYVLCDYKEKRYLVKVLSVSNKGILTIKFKSGDIKTVSYMDIKFLLS